MAPPSLCTSTRLLVNVCTGRMLIHLSACRAQANAFTQLQALEPSTSQPSRPRNVIRSIACLSRASFSIMSVHWESRVVAVEYHTSGFSLPGGKMLRLSRHQTSFGGRWWQIGGLMDAMLLLSTLVHAKNAS